MTARDNPFPAIDSIGCSYEGEHWGKVFKGVITGVSERFVHDKVDCNTEPIVCIAFFDGASEAFGFCENSGSWYYDGNNIKVIVNMLGMLYTIFNVKKDP